MMENIESLEAAVLIRGACKSYGNDKILDNLNVTVTKGTIYGLLGASGCGKTTLLGTIVGTRVIQKGVISVLGQPPGVIPTKSIGYMPQETALLGEFSVKNALQFQGYIFGMTDEQIKERHQFLEELLDLPPANQLVKTLSGGQQRRLSLAMVLVHDPELLILDEPTVGLDPILRQNLWDYLVKLTTEDKKTIIITTHYLEEARQAHTIGLLRNGKILSEGEPQALLDRYNCTTIEGVFAKLSRQQERVRIGTELEQQKNENMLFFDDFKPSPEIKINKIFFTNKGHAKALMLKNIVRVIRHPGLLIVAFILPILQVSIFFLAIGVVPSDLAIGVVNEELDNYPDCNAYVMDKNLVGGEVLEDNRTCVYSGLGCMFLNKLDAIPVKKYYKTSEEAFREMKKGKFHHILHFPRNYSDSITIVRDDTQYFTDDDLDFQQINVYRDVRDLTLGLLIEKELYFTYQRFAEELAIDCGKNKLAEKLPIIFLEPVFGTYDVTYTDYTAPGIILLIALFLAVGLSLLTITTERTEGMWERTIVSGVKPVEILFFHTVVSCVISLIEFIELFILSFYVFHVKCEGNVFYVFLLLYSQAVVGICMGTLISVFSRSITEAIFVGLGTFIPLIVISGCVWPLQGMPEILKYVSYFTPPTVPIESLRAVLYKGWGITEFVVFKGLLTSVGFCIFYTSLSVLTIKFEKK